MVWEQSQALKFYASWGIMVATLCQGVEFYASVDGYERSGCVKGKVFTRRMVGWGVGFYASGVVKIVEKRC